MSAAAKPRTAGWQKPPAELIAKFDAALPVDPRVDRRQMFGYPSAFAMGHLFTGIHNGRILVRLGAEKRDELLAQPGAGLFEPMPGRVMREYAVLPPSFLKRKSTLTAWMAEALAYVATLPPKRRRAKATRPRRSAT